MTNCNQGISCNVCNAHINFRIQVGYIDENEFRFSCPKCKIPININIKYSRKDGKQILEKTEIKNAKFEYEKSFQSAEYQIQSSVEFITSKNIINPYLGKGDIRDLFTPNMQSHVAIGHTIERQNHIIRIINTLHNYEKFEMLNTLYFLKSDYFVKEINKTFKDMNYEHMCMETDFSKTESIWLFNITYLNQFLKRNKFSEINMKIQNDFKELKSNEEGFKKLLDFIEKEDIIDTYEKRIIRTIEKYIVKFKYFLPVISLEYIEENDSRERLMKDFTIRTCTFDDIKDIYLETYENTIDIYALLAGCNNLINREDINLFELFNKVPNHPMRDKENEKPKKPKNLKSFMSMNKAPKIAYTGLNEKFDKYMPILNPSIRNSLGHENWEYIDSDSMIKIKNKNKSVEDIEISILQYSYDCYEMFIKVISLYKVLIDLKVAIIRNRELNK